MMFSSRRDPVDVFNDPDFMPELASLQKWLIGGLLGRLGSIILMVLAGLTASTPTVGILILYAAGICVVVGTLAAIIALITIGIRLYDLEPIRITHDLPM